MPDRPVSKYAHDVTNARRLLLDEVREHRAKHGKPVTVIWARYGTGSFNAAIVTGEVPAMLAEMERFVGADTRSIESMKSTFVYVMQNNEHYGEGKGAAVRLLLWLLCREPRVRALAEKGDCALGYEIRSRELASGGTGVKFRLIAERLEPEVGL